MCKLNSVEEWFRWKLSEEVLKKYELNKIKYKSVEEENRDLAKVLGWKGEIDVLYSFLLLYKLGLQVVNETRFKQIKTEVKNKWGIQRLNESCPEFIFICSQDAAYTDFNNCPEIVKFVKLYFSIGNVIPIWPGGNEARGKKGVYDMPEFFFNKDDIWTKTLIEEYKNIHLDSIINNDKFLVCRQKESTGYTIKGYSGIFKDIREFKKLIMSNNQIYFDYLIRRNNVIIKREEQLNKYIKDKNIK